MHKHLISSLALAAILGATSVAPANAMGWFSGDDEAAEAAKAAEEEAAKAAEEAKMKAEEEAKAAQEAAAAEAAEAKAAAGAEAAAAAEAAAGQVFAGAAPGGAADAAGVARCAQEPQVQEGQDQETGEMEVHNDQ